MLSAATQAVLSRLLYLQRLRDHIAAVYVPSDDPRCVVRMSDLAQTVAARLGVASSPRLRTDLRHALALDGRKIHRHCGRFVVLGLRRVDQTEADALAESRKVMARGTRRELRAYRTIGDAA